MAALFSPSDLALAARLMRKQPLLSLTAVLALATGMFLATTGFTLLEGVLWARLPFSSGDRFVLVDAFEEPQATPATVDDARFEALRAATALEHLGAVENAAQNLELPSGDVVLVPAVAITPDSFAVLPFAPLVGRGLTAGDRHSSVIVIRETLWRRHFSADPSIVGKAATFSGVSRTVVGVMPAAMEFPTSPEAWFPLESTKDARVFGVLAPAARLPLAQSQLAMLSSQFEAAQPAAPKLRLRVLEFTDALSQGLDMLTGALVFVLVLVLLVISANLGNLVLARTLSRSSELAIRTALGASRARLVTQVFCEVLLLGGIAAAIGVSASELTLAWIRSSLNELPFWVDFSIGPYTVLFVVAITVLASAVAGVWPAVRATRRDPAIVLAGSSRAVAAGFPRASLALIAVQIALSIAALQAALVVARGVAGYSEGAKLAVDSQVLTATVYAPPPVDARTAQAAVVAALERVPSVRSAALSTSLPRLSPPTVMTAVRNANSDQPSEPRAAPLVAVSEHFFDTLATKAVAGRLFSANDFSGAAAPVALVNVPFVQKFFGGENPLGRQLAVMPTAADGRVEWREIVGVVPELGLSAGDSSLSAGFYVPLADEALFSLSILTSGDLTSLSRSLHRIVADADPHIQIHDVRTLANVGSEDRAVFAGIGAALTSLGGVALLLSAIGLYAMLSFAVTQRAREIAIRVALGARRDQILRTLFSRIALPVAIGVIAGPLLGQSLIAVRGIFAFRLPADAGGWATPLLGAIMIGAGALAMSAPARRALRINTAEALRGD